eukprot:s120_g30.t1
MDQSFIVRRSPADSRALVGAELRLPLVVKGSCRMTIYKCHSHGQPSQFHTTGHQMGFEELDLQERQSGVEPDLGPGEWRSPDIEPEEQQLAFASLRAQTAPDPLAGASGDGVATNRNKEFSCPCLCRLWSVGASGESGRASLRGGRGKMALSDGVPPKSKEGYLNTIVPYSPNLDISYPVSDKPRWLKSFLVTALWTQELSLPIALKLGAWRGMSPDLDPCCGGDGVASADLASLQALCAKFPKVKFLVTVLSRANQHELTVVVQKTRNLHLYGCWWYCNNPSIIEELTKMRTEMLGTAYTAQHSDCRVLEQLNLPPNSCNALGLLVLPQIRRCLQPRLAIASAALKAGMGEAAAAVVDECGMETSQERDFEALWDAISKLKEYLPLLSGAPTSFAIQKLRRFTTPSLAPVLAAASGKAKCSNSAPVSGGSKIS